MNDRIISLIEKHREEVIEARHRFHEYPELSMKEYETIGYIVKILEAHGISYEVVNGTSAIATIDSGRPGKILGIRGDIDGLPIQEEVDIPFASKVPNVSQACGHDCHGAMVLGAALILNECKEEWKGIVKIIFQEGEEVGLGAKHIVDSTDSLNDVEEFIALHVNPYLDKGVFGTCPGPMFAANHQGKIMVEGLSGHGSIPEKAINPVVVSSHIISAIEYFAAYGFDTFAPYVVVPTMIKGGTKVNNIPRTAEIAFDCRYFDEKFRAEMDSRFISMVKKTAEAFGAKASVEFDYTAIVPLYNDEKLTEKANKIITNTFGENALLNYPAEMGSEDFGVFLETNKVPGFYAYLGAAEKGKYTAFHSEDSYYSDDCLIPGVEFMIQYVLES